MKLLVDAGNSRVKWAWLEGDALLEPGAEPHAGGDFAAVLRTLVAGGRRPGAILLASVLMPSRTEALVAALSAAFGLAPQVASTEIAAAGVRNGYRDYGQLGVDRWLGMLAAFASHRSAVCIVDAGTAVTVDVVAGDGTHRGGLIIPGQALMHAVLLKETAVKRTASDITAGAAPRTLGMWGRDTDSCIRRGTARATACLVENCMKTLTRDEGGGTLVLTGGDATALGGELSLPWEHRPLLVLEGLALRYGRD